MNKLTGYLCIALLGISGWPLPASAQANQGPTCDEITSGYICDGQFIPELVVTADRVVWTAPTNLADYLALLEHDVDQLSAFISASVANVMAAQNQYGDYQPSASRISQAQDIAEEVLEVKQNH
ncbi:MAG: hypothetical protein F4220_15125 [Gammaproteobacteria bacterium]|nr:hypothetical protein [Gammaproteobacteria bacterium]